MWLVTRMGFDIYSTAWSVYLYGSNVRFWKPETLKNPFMNLVCRYAWTRWSNSQTIVFWRSSIASSNLTRNNYHSFFSTPALDSCDRAYGANTSTRSHCSRPTGIEPATFRFVAQHLNHCATAVPSLVITNSNCNSCICPTLRCTVTW